MTYEIMNLCGQGLFLKIDGFRLIYCCIALFMWSVYCFLKNILRITAIRLVIMDF